MNLARYFKVAILVCTLFSATSCNDWLDVNPKTEKDKEELLSKPSGFRNALIGAYIRLKTPNLYGKEMTWGVVENLAQHWDYEKETVGYYLKDYDYSAAVVKNALGSLFNNLYKTVADVNSILEVIDEKKSIFTSGEYELIKGEALAIRAFCHFDVLRLFGPIPSNAGNAPILPYVTVVSKDINQHVSYQAFTEKLMGDLDEAEKLLKEVDLIRTYSIAELNADEVITTTSDNSFARYRQMRFNYYAVEALKARLYLWMGNKEKAAFYASEVVNAVDKSNKKMFRLGTKQDISLSDFVLSPEHVLNLNIYDMASSVVVRNFYSKSKEVLESDLFNTSATDIRVSKWWELQLATSTSAKKNFLTKFDQRDGMPALSRNSLPLIRLSELYLILMECSSLADAKLYYDELASARDFEPIGTIANEQELEDILVKEYNKEFYGEGQAFYAYKRLNRKAILWSSKEGGEDVYVIPLPQGEVVY